MLERYASCQDNSFLSFFLFLNLYFSSPLYFSYVSFDHIILKGDFIILVFRLAWLKGTLLWVFLEKVNVVCEPFLRSPFAFVPTSSTESHGQPSSTAGTTGAAKWEQKQRTDEFVLWVGTRHEICEHTWQHKGDSESLSDLGWFPKKPLFSFPSFSPHCNTLNFRLGFIFNYLRSK